MTLWRFLTAAPTIFLILTLGLSIPGLFLGIRGVKNDGNKRIVGILTFLVLLNLNYLISFLSFYIYGDLLFSVDSDYFLSLINLIGVNMMFFFVPFMAHTLFPSGHTKQLNILFFCFAFLSILFKLVGVLPETTEMRLVLFVIQYLIGCYAAFYNVVCVFRLPRGLVHGSKDLYFVMLSSFVIILVTPLAIIFEHSLIHPLAMVEGDQVLPFYAMLINLAVLLTLVSKRNWLPISEITEAHSQNLSNQKYPKHRAKQLLEARFQLTSREREVLHYLLEDLSYKCIAEKLQISPSTAKTHAARIYQKMKLTGKNELKAYLASLSS